MNRWEVMRLLSLYQGEEGEGEGEGEGVEDDPPQGGSGGGRGDITVDGEVIPRDVLPEDFRDRPASEVKFLLRRLTEGVRDRNNEVQTLKEQLQEVQARLESPPEPDEPEEYRDLPTEDLLVEDAEAAILRVLKKNGMIDAFQNHERRLDETEFEIVARSIDDFTEYEDDVRQILKESGTRPTRQNIMGAYTMAVGHRTLEERQRKSRENVSIEESKPKQDERQDDLPELTGLELEIFKASGMTREEWDQYQADKAVDVEVPTG